MRSRLVLAGLAGGALIASPSALGVDARPLPRRDGVVVSWQAKSRTAVVVVANRRVYTVHSLRRVRPGTRVRINGIKWRTPVAGIKWSIAPRGIKWGIKLARNGTYQSRLTAVGVSTTASLRARVVRRYGRRAVAVSVRGATVLLPLARRAVWLPSGKVQKDTAPLGAFGSTVIIRIDFVRGRPVARRVIQVAPPAPGTSVPIAGQIIASDPSAGSITVRAGTAAFPLDATITVPPIVNLSLYPAGSVLASRVMSTPDGRLRAVELSLNGSFAQADSPVTSIAIPAGTPLPAQPAPPPPGTTPPGPGTTPPGPGVLADAAALRQDWIAARSMGWIPNTGLYTANLRRLERIEALTAAGDVTLAVTEIDAFIALLNSVPASQIELPFRTTAIKAASDLRARLVGG